MKVLQAMGSMSTAHCVNAVAVAAAAPPPAARLHSPSMNERPPAPAYRSSPSRRRPPVLGGETALPRCPVP